MSEILERVARALAKQDSIEHELSEPIDWKLYRQNARAAIEAMRGHQRCAECICEDGECKWIKPVGQDKANVRIVVENYDHKPGGVTMVKR